MKKSRTEVDAHLGKRWPADGKVQWSKLLTAGMLRGRGRLSYMSRQSMQAPLSSVVSRSWEASTLPPRQPYLSCYWRCLLPPLKHIGYSIILVVQMCQKGFSLFWTTLLKCKWILKSNLNFRAMRTFRVRQLDCSQLFSEELWGSLGQGGRGSTKQMMLWVTCSSILTRAVCFYLNQ